jgi:hypothetical protein
MRIGEVLNAVYDEEVGWRPATGQIKPVHVANGLVRALAGEYYDISPIVEFLVGWKKGRVPDPDRSYQRLVLEDPLGPFGYFKESQSEFDKARRYAFGLLNADNAVYPSAENSALTLTCGEMASRSRDFGLGQFGAALLESGDSEALATILRRSLEVKRPDDPITTIVWPLLSDNAKPTSAAETISKALRKKHHQACLKEFQLAAKQLASHEEQQGNRLRTLERVVHFVCIATHAHAQALAADGSLADRPPLLMALTGEKRSELAIASERSLEEMYSKFESWLVKQEAIRLRGKKPLTRDERLEELSIDGRTARKILKQILSAQRNPPEEPDAEILSARMADFEDAKRAFGKDDPALLMAHAVVRSYLREFESGGPRSFLQSLARKVGLLYPHFQGNSRDKRVRPSVAILDLLVRACVPVRAPIPLDEFLERLWRTFGLVVGGRTGGDECDADLLSRNGIDVDPSVLVANTIAFVDTLASMGLARRFADNVTFVGDGYAG